MNKRFLTTFYPKIKSNRIGPKVESMSKLDLTEKINNSKFDYFDIMSKIKAKNKELGNVALFHEYLLYNNKQKQNYLRYKLINLNDATLRSALLIKIFEHRSPGLTRFHNI